MDEPGKSAPLAVDADGAHLLDSREFSSFEVLQVAPDSGSASKGHPAFAIGDSQALKPDGVSRVDSAEKGASAVRGLQDALGASVEADLANEVRGLILTLQQFGARAQLIGQRAEGSQFCQPVALFLALSSLQIAVALGQAMNEGVFLDDGGEYLRKLSLSAQDLFRQVDLDGRRFLAVALVDQQPGQGLGVGEAGNE